MCIRDRVYIDDVVASFIAAMEGRAARDCSMPGYCHLMCDAYDVTLGRLAELIESCLLYTSIAVFLMDKHFL